MCVYSGAPPFESRIFIVNIRYFEDHDAGGAAAIHRSTNCVKDKITKLCFNVKRDRCNETNSQKLGT
jgi:hypothetical protein